MTACVVERFKELRFPQPEGGIVTVVYPIVFEPGDGSPASSTRGLWLARSDTTDEGDFSLPRGGSASAPESRACADAAARDRIDEASCLRGCGGQ